MIVPMKKVTLLCVADERDDALQKLRDLGTVHVEAVTPPRSQDLDAVAGKLQKAKSTQVMLDSVRKKATAPASSAEMATIIDEAVSLIQRERELNLKIGQLSKEKDLLEPYGNFEPGLIKDLASAGITVKLYEVQDKAPGLPDDSYMFVLGQKGKVKFCAVISKKDFEYDAKEFDIPERSLSEIDNEIEMTQKALAETTTALEGLSQNQQVVKDVIAHLESDAEMIETKEGMGLSGAVSYLQGFCPENLVDNLLEASKEHGWGLVVDDPAPEDKVPTLIESPKWVKPIKSLFGMLDILPGYKEVDIRSVFYIFFALFFSMLVADGGYGIIFLIAAIVLRRKFKKAPAEPFILVGVLSICAIAWGVITGSYFGIEDLPAPLSALRIDWLHSEEHIIMFSFLIGAIHLTVAHAWRALLTINSTRAIGQLGWICLTWCMYFLSKSLILGMEMPSFFTPLFVTGLALVTLFMTPFKLLKKEWADHVMLPFDVVGNFADLVSYVRLFAVGSASLAVATAFNELAIGEGIESVTGGIVAVIILFLGHALNIVLCLMSILVHGVRLNTLEFSGHIGLEWSGFKYKPFEQNKSLGQKQENQ